jgi:hypothetical protein
MEVKYKKTPKFFEKQMDLLKRNLLEFPEYNITKPDTILMRTESNPIKMLTLDISRIVLNYEEPDSLDDFINSSTNICSNTLKELSITNVERIGVRSYWFLSMKNDETKSLLIDKLSLGKLSEIGEYSQPPEFKVFFNKADVFINIAAKSIRLQKFGIDQINTFVKNDEGILLDIDIFVNNKGIKLEGYFQNVLAINKAVLQKFI